MKIIRKTINLIIGVLIFVIFISTMPLIVLSTFGLVIIKLLGKMIKEVR